MRSFSVRIDWLVATGQTIADQFVTNWCRRAAQCGFHLFPVPEEPFDRADNAKSAPLRCPIYVPLPDEQAFNDRAKLQQFRFLCSYDMSE